MIWGLTGIAVGFAGYVAILVAVDRRIRRAGNTWEAESLYGWLDGLAVVWYFACFLTGLFVL